MSRKIFLLLILLAGIRLHVLAGDGNYAVILIKPDLKKNAHAVMRFDDVTIEIKSINEMVVKKKWIVTVFDSEGDDYASVSEYYNDFTKVISIDGALYDAWGKKIKSVKKSDINDESAVSSMSLMEDSRVKRHQFDYKAYPYTVEYETEVRQTQTMFLTGWNPLSGYNVGVEQSTYNVITPVDYKLRYKLTNSAGEPVVSNGANTKTYHWEMRNQLPIERVWASPGWGYAAPHVYIGATDFAIKEFNGNMSDWTSFGKSMYKLVSNRDQLPPQIKSKVHQLTDGLATPQEKVTKIYEYLQGSTRYVSIQLGIGGWQPFDANYVATNGYGDCKALSNYMYSLLKEVGIKSYYTLIKAGSLTEDMPLDFPSSPFNHVILCVPFEKDSLWLECTSQTESAGYMGSFTGNRHALLITEEGGKVISTPSYNSKENLKTRLIKATIDADGNLSMSVVTKYQAIEQEQIYLHFWSEDQKWKNIRSQFDLGTYDVTKLKYEEHKCQLPFVVEDVEISSRNYASVSGRRIFISPNVLSKSEAKLIHDEDRKLVLRMPPGKTESDSTEISVPEGFIPESIPDEVNLNTKFGKYYSKARVENGKINYVRRFESAGGYFPPTDYVELVNFYDQIYKADRNKVVLVKKE